MDFLKELWVTFLHGLGCVTIIAFVTLVIIIILFSSLAPWFIGGLLVMAAIFFILIFGLLARDFFE